MAGESESRDPDLPLSSGGRILASELVEQASRSGGPGGQHVNTSSTRVTLRWNVRRARGLSAEARTRLLERLEGRLSRDGALIVHADRHRSRARNREDARARLLELVEGALYEQAPRRATRPTRASRARRLEAKRRRGQLKDQRRSRPGDQD